MGRRRAVLMAATIALTASGVVATNADWNGSAHWGGCEFGVCGTVVNGLDIPVDVALSWCEWKTAPCEIGTIYTIAAKSSSDATGKVDIDAFRVPDGLRYEVVLTRAFGEKTTWFDPGW